VHTRAAVQQLVTPEQIERILRATDQLRISRDAVVIPMVADRGTGRALVMPDGKLLVRAPVTSAFDSWFASFSDALTLMDLAKVPRTNKRV
jgi:hypothetical protein